VELHGSADHHQVPASMSSVLRSIWVNGESPFFHLIFLFLSAIGNCEHNHYSRIPHDMNIHARAHLLLAVKLPMCTNVQDICRDMQ
jgi:hypothetical protein